MSLKTAHWLGDAYKSFPESHEEAIAWWLKAAGEGKVDAQYLYAHAFCAGDGAPQCDLESDIWMDSAISGNSYVLKLEEAAAVIDGAS